MYDLAASIDAGGNAVSLAEVLGKVALIGEPGGRGRDGWRATLTQQPTGTSEALLNEVGVRRYAEGVAEGTCEVKRA